MATNSNIAPMLLYQGAKPALTKEEEILLDRQLAFMLEFAFAVADEHLKQKVNFESDKSKAK